MKKTITRTSTRALAVLLALLMLATSVPFAVAEYDCQHEIECMYHRAEGQIRGYNGKLCVEHWYCPGCSRYFTDAEATHELTYDQVFSISCLHNNMAHYAAGDHANNEGYLCVEYWYCTECYKYFDDAAAAHELTYDGVYSIPCPHTKRYHYEEQTPFCGSTGEIECWQCSKCYQYFADETSNQPLTYGQLTLTSPYAEHDFKYDVGFEDEGNGHVWLSTTSYREKKCMEENGMTFAQMFKSEGFTAEYCANCGVVIHSVSGNVRPETLGLFVNPIGGIEGTVKVPTSPEGLSVGEKWVDLGSYLSLSIVADDLSDENSTEVMLFMLSILSEYDFYYNETTQKMYSGLTSLDEDFKFIYALRTVGDDANTTALPSSPNGLATGQKWFDAVSFYQDAISQYVPTDDEDRANFEVFLSRIAAAEFSLSPDGNKVFVTGCNEPIAEFIDNNNLEEESLNLFHGGNWFASLNDLFDALFETAFTFNALDYVKTVEGDCAHVWNGGTVTKNPNCTQAGIKTYTCTLCSEPREEIIPALGHNWDGGTVTKQPTMTDTGTCAYTCSRCTETKTTTIPRLDPTPLLDELKNKQDLKDTADDAAVFFDADANLPADTVFDYEILEQTKFYQIFDLTLTSGGKEVEPETPVWVKLPVPKGWNPNLITVWHGSEKLPSFVDGGYVYFYTSHFSEFQVKYDEGQGDDKPTTEPQTEPQANANACKLCGEVHTGILGALVGLLHRIIYFFKHLFG